jgi:hypothetical protein
MEQAIRKGSKRQTSTSGRDTYTASFESFYDLPEELSASPLSDEVVVNLVEVYFPILRDLFFNFLHQGLFITQMQEQILPKPLIYAVCAANARLLLPLLD